MQSIEEKGHSKSKPKWKKKANLAKCSVIVSASLLSLSNTNRTTMDGTLTRRKVPT